MKAPPMQFFGRAPAYYSEGDLLSRKENTLSIDAARRVIAHIGCSLQCAEETKAGVLDIAGGTGYFSILLAREYSHLDAFVLDRSAGMLEIGQRYVMKHQQDAYGRVSFMQGDAHSLPVSRSSIKCALIFCAMHLLDPVGALTNVYRVLIPGGNLHILTWRPNNILNTMYHSYFPRYAEIDIPRYNFVRSLPRLLRDSGFSEANESGIGYRIHYETVEEAVAISRRRPFSTFAYYSDAELCSAISLFENRLRKRFGHGPVINEAEMTLFSTQKLP